MEYILKHVILWEQKLCNLNCVLFDMFHEKNKRYVI